MNFPLLLVLAAGFSGPAAGAESLDEYRRLPECRLSADGKHLLQEPCRTAPARKNMPRRPVPLNVTPTPRIAPAPDPSLTWAPMLTRRDPNAAPGAIAQLPRGGAAGVAAWGNPAASDAAARPQCADPGAVRCRRLPRLQRHLLSRPAWAGY